MSSTNKSVPKGKAKKPSQVAKKPRVKPQQDSSPNQAKKPEPLYHLIGKKRVAFLEVARVLAGDLHLTYGDEMSINKFGRILMELKGQTGLKELVYLEQKTLELFHKYEQMKQEMIEEQNAFRTSFSTSSLMADIPQKVIDIFDEEKSRREKLFRANKHEEDLHPDGGEDGPSF
jgi:hypothetical protein